MTDAGQADDATTDPVTPRRSRPALKTAALVGVAAVVLGGLALAITSGDQGERANAADGACVPVVMVVRHAEDINGPPPVLTTGGKWSARGCGAGKWRRLVLLLLRMLADGSCPARRDTTPVGCDDGSERACRWESVPMRVSHAFIRRMLRAAPTLGAPCPRACGANGCSAAGPLRAHSFSSARALGTSERGSARTVSFPPAKPRLAPARMLGRASRRACGSSMMRLLL